MKLDNFKELLLKKSGDNKSLQTLIKYMKDDYLLDHVVESLEKMAISKNQRRSVNPAILRFAKFIDPEAEVPMFHDALSHHASHYKAALESGNEKLADQHMSQIFHTMYLAQQMTQDRGTNHTSKTGSNEDAKLRVSYVDPKPWERVGYSDNLNESTGKYQTDTEGFRRNVKRRKDGKSPFFWLRGAPHGHAYFEGDDRYAGEIADHGHTGAYPLEEITVNDKHIHIDDVESPGEYVAHPFDSHPIFEFYRKSLGSMDNQQKRDFIRKKWAYQDGEDFVPDEGDKRRHKPRTHSLQDFWDMVNARDPEQHAARGSKKSKPIHKDVEDKLDISRILEARQRKKAPISKPDIAEISDVEAPKPKTIRRPGSSFEETKAKLEAIKAGKKVDMPETQAPKKAGGPDPQETKAMLDQIKNKFKGKV